MTFQATNHICWTNFLTLILRHKPSQTQGLWLGEDVFIGCFSHLRNRIGICWNKQWISSPSLTNKSWNRRAYFQAEKGAGKIASDINKENRLSHRILNPFWMTVFTGAIWIWHEKSVWLRQTRLAERLWGITEENTDVFASWDGKPSSVCHYWDEGCTGGWCHCEETWVVGREEKQS